MVANWQTLEQSKLSVWIGRTVLLTRKKKRTWLGGISMQRHTKIKKKTENHDFKVVIYL